MSKLHKKIDNYNQENSVYLSYEKRWVLSVRFVHKFFYSSTLPLFYIMPHTRVRYLMSTKQMNFKCGFSTKCLWSLQMNCVLIASQNVKYQSKWCVFPLWWNSKCCLSNIIFILQYNNNNNNKVMNDWSMFLVTNIAYYFLDHLSCVSDFCLKYWLCVKIFVFQYSSIKWVLHYENTLMIGVRWSLLF